MEKRRKYHSLMGQVLELRGLKAAYEEVRANHGAPGVDGVSVEEFGERLEENLLDLATSGAHLSTAPGQAGFDSQAGWGSAAFGNSGGQGPSRPAGGVWGVGADL